MKDLFLAVVETSVSVSPIIVTILILSSYLSRRYAAKWKYFIWIGIAARLILPFPLRLPVPRLVVDVPARITAPVNGEAGAAVPLVPQAAPEIPQITLLDIAACLWLLGCLLFLAVHIVSFLHFRKQICRAGEEVEDEKILRHICRLSGELRIRPDLQVVRYPDAGSPMMIGFFKPVLVLPDCGYDEEELFFILKHELVHFKCHDIYFKLLFIAANAVHWFNPLLYAMQREAVIDMELSCDERVVRRTPYAVRKAYTETLFSTLSRQYKKGTTLTTQFYGGKSVMKKRFKNILIRSEKRNGAVISMCAVCLTLVSGMFIGCSAAGNISSGVQAQARPETDRSGAVTEKLPDLPADTASQTGQEISGMDTNSGGSVKIALSADSEQIMGIIDEFAAAYFSGDIGAVKSLLPDSYAWDVTAYEGTGSISDIALQGLPDAGEQAVGSVLTVTMQYRDSTYEDMFQYLTFELIRRDAGWEIQFYGVEG